MTTLWEVEIQPAPHVVDRSGARALEQCRALGASSIRTVRTGKSYLIQGDLSLAAIDRIAAGFLADTVVETCICRDLVQAPAAATGDVLLNVLYKPGVTDNTAHSVHAALADLGHAVHAVRTCQKYWFNADASPADLAGPVARALSNDAIQQTVWGPLHLHTLAFDSAYAFRRVVVPICEMHDAALQQLSQTGQLYLSLAEMQTIQRHFRDQGREPTDAELETIAQTWSEHCSHKTLRGRVRYRDDTHEREFGNLLKETIFAATAEIRRRLGPADWCVSVFADNAGVVQFDAANHVCFKVETHNHPSALEPYGGANTGLGGVIRDPMGTGLGARPICNTNVFCFAPPDMPHAQLPAGVLHPQVVARGVVAGVRDYGNRMGIPTVNGALYFDERYLGNPLVYCGNVALLPADKVAKAVSPGELIVALGGRTGRDGIHGATFSSAELTHESETLSGGAVQIGDAVTEKMVLDVLLAARDRGLYSAVTDCGAGGFSSAVGEMGADTGAEVWLDRAPLKYAGLSYTEIWISEAQERMVLAVPPAKWLEFHKLCAAEGVEATVIGEFTNTGRLVLKYHDEQVGELGMAFLHDGRPPVVRDAVYQPPAAAGLQPPARARYDEDLRQILGSLNVCSKAWVIRQYDHEVQGGSVIKPLVGLHADGPGDAAVLRPDLTSLRGVVVACGMNPRFGDLDPYWMAASAIDEAVRNCIAVGADPARIAILDNFCWGNTDRPEILGSLVRAALACHDVALDYGTPFISGKDSLNNEFAYLDHGERKTVVIPPSLLISALGQMADIRRAVSMDLKQPGHLLFLVGQTHDELGGSHFALVNKLTGGRVPRVNGSLAPRIFKAVHAAIDAGHVRSCHDISEGGLAAAIAEMSFAGELGAELHLAGIADHTLTDAALLFSESNTRFVLEVAPAQRENLLGLFAGLPIAEIGRVNQSDRLRVFGVRGSLVIDSGWAELKACWLRPLAWD